MCICVYVYMCICVYVYMCICVCVYVYMYVCMYVMYVMYVCMYVCIYLSMYLCMYIYIYFIMCIYIYIHIHILCILKKKNICRNTANSRFWSIPKCPQDLMPASCSTTASVWLSNRSADWNSTTFPWLQCHHGRIPPHSAPHVDRIGILMPGQSPLTYITSSQNVRKHRHR
jgi:hypothetical protein